MAVRDQPILTEIFSAPNKFLPENGSVFLLGTSVEQRSVYPKEWENIATANAVTFVRVINQYATYIDIVLAGSTVRIQLRSSKQLKELWSKIGDRTVYLDITGLGHHVWAPLLKSALASKRRLELKVIYREPIDYKFMKNPIEGEIYDLSETISGIAPIPGFASLTHVGDDNVCFIPLLGFEGTRLSFIIERVQPPRGNIVPIIGVPGFLPHYPFQTYHGNQLPLLQTKAWRNVHFATANCPFSLFYVLEDIASKYSSDFLRIAPIG